MQEIVLLSGKGGTGKTSIVGSLAALTGQKVLADCDVDAADLDLLLSPKLREEHEFFSGQTAAIDDELCIQCGLCQELCRFGAIRDYTVDPIVCEGCGFCARVCPLNAIEMRESMSGFWYVSNTRYGPLVHARLGIGQENSGKLVARVRQTAREIAIQEGLDLIICDGPPGTGCPVISSLSGADLALLVTEPTLSGLHDLERVIRVCHHFNIPPIVCINKYDINMANTRRIEEFCTIEDIEVVARIPFDNVVTLAMVQGQPVVEYDDGPVSQEIGRLWQRTLGKLSTNVKNRENK